jgi:hypothetical protein
MKFPWGTDARHRSAPGAYGRGLSLDLRLAQERIEQPLLGMQLVLQPPDQLRRKILLRACVHKRMLLSARECGACA